MVKQDWSYRATMCNLNPERVNGCQARKETVSASRVFLMSFQELRSCIDSKSLVTAWHLFPLLLFCDSISYLRSKQVIPSLAAEVEAHSAEILLTKQAFNFRFRNIKRWSWKENGEANQWGDTGRRHICSTAPTASVCSPTCGIQKTPWWNLR